MKAEKRQQVTMNKDIFLEKLLNSKALYVILLACVLAYLYSDDKILNLPNYLFISKFVIVIVSLSIFVLWRRSKYKTYYERKFKDKVYLVGLFLGLVVFSLIIQGVLNIPLNYIILTNSKNNSVESFNCEITNVVTTNIDKIHFKFMGNKYSRYYNVNDYERKDLMQNYWLNIQVRKSNWDTYCIESMNLQRKN